MKVSYWVVLFLVSVSLAGQTGHITGKVTDKKSGQPLPGATVYVEGTSWRVATNLKGEYKIDNIPSGKYTLIGDYVGYETKKLKNLTVFADSTILVNIKLVFTGITKRNKFNVMAQAPDGNHMFLYRTAKSAGSAVSREQSIIYNTEEYDRIYESGFFEVLQQPLSTFAADVDVASYGNVRRFLLNDQIPPKDAVRSEEFINYFSYDYPPPGGENPLSINLEYSVCPWTSEHHLIHIGLKGKQILKEDQVASNLVFLLDVSGSMNSPKKLPLLKRSFKLLVEQLNAEDRIAIVVYAGSSGLVLPATPGSEKEKIVKALDQLQAGGSTAGGAGIKQAYKVAKDNFIKDGNNRVILATDGDFNVGISSTSELVRFIEKKRDDGIFLTVLGFGMGNYKDNRLQELADRGNGNHAYIDNIMEAKKVLVNEVNSTLYTIAKDVKIQVEFNPAKIHSYRLIGYENRELEDKDFADDSKDAGEIGAGHTVTALYEVVPADVEVKDSQELKYQKTKIRQSAKKSNEVLTVRIRYKQPDASKSLEFSDVLKEKPARFNKTSENFRFAAAVAEFAMILRDSEFKGDANLEHALQIAKGSMGNDPFGYRAEFINLVRRADLLLEYENDIPQNNAEDGR